MDCAACGKPISVTAKFCGKCGAPVKRGAPSPQADSADASTQLPILSEDHAASATAANVSADSKDIGNNTHHADNLEEMVLNLTPPNTTLEDRQLLTIDLNLESLENSVTTSTHEHQTTNQSDALDMEILVRFEKHQKELKSTLEKHSLLLDFISLASQQQSHYQSQPDPNEGLLRQLSEQQAQLATQLTDLQSQLQQISTASPGRVPEEYKLLLEKQKIELQKSFSQNIAQNSENITSTQQAELTRVQEMLTANTLAAEGIAKNLTPLIQSVNDLKTKVQAVVQKVDDLPSSRSKVNHKDSSDGEGGGFMVFVIGMLCGLTVVLSSLAIYNFLTHDAASTDASAKVHDKTVSESPSKGHDKPASEGNSKGHEKATSENSSSAKSGH